MGHLPVKHLHRSFGVDFAGEDDGSKSTRSAIGSKGNVGSQHRPRLPEKVFQVLPLTVERELRKELVRIGMRKRKTPTFPTNKFLLAAAVDGLDRDKKSSGFVGTVEMV